MVKIYKYKNYLETTEYKPDQGWSQVDNNLTSIAAILISIDNLEENECLVIRKIPQNLKMEKTNKQWTNNTKEI